jgi:hypothetical protein
LTLGKSMKVALSVAVAAVMLGAVLASSAAAAIVPAKFSSPFFKFTTSGITLKLNGAEAKTCNPSPTTIEGFAEGNQYLMSNQQGGETRFACPNNTMLTMAWKGQAFYDSVSSRYSLRIGSYCCSSLMSPYGQYSQEPGTIGGTWVNGSGSTASTLTFSNEMLGWTLTGKKITIDGTFKATNSLGGLLTLSH